MGINYDMHCMNLFLTRLLYAISGRQHEGHVAGLESQEGKFYFQYVLTLFV